MIIGSGMIASALSEVRSLRNCVAYAAGVSNPNCTDQDEFARDRDRLEEAMKHEGQIVYFSSFSMMTRQTSYATHKMYMEGMVKKRGNYLICRLSTVAGRTPNPHTLLNYLYSRIARSERFDLYTKARRNVIDVADVARGVDWLLRRGTVNEVVNVASPRDYPVTEIVEIMARLLRKHPIVREVDSGDVQHIDTRLIEESDIDFSGDYLERTLARYYA